MESNKTSFRHHRYRFAEDGKCILHVDQDVPPDHGVIFYVRSMIHHSHLFEGDVIVAGRVDPGPRNFQRGRININSVEMPMRPNQARHYQRYLAAAATQFQNPAAVY